MTLMLNLTEELEIRLKSEAERRGLEASELARQLVEAGLQVDVQLQKKLNQSTLDLLSKWDSVDATAGPEELARRNREVEEFRAAMNRNRIETEGPNARTPFP